MIIIVSQTLFSVSPEELFLSTVHHRPITLNEELVVEERLVIFLRVVHIVQLL